MGTAVKNFLQFMLKERFQREYPLTVSMYVDCFYSEALSDRLTYCTSNTGLTKGKRFVVQLTKNSNGKCFAGIFQGVIQSPA